MCKQQKMLLMSKGDAPALPPMQLHCVQASAELLLPEVVEAQANKRPAEGEAEGGDAGPEAAAGSGEDAPEADQDENFISGDEDARSEAGDGRSRILEGGGPVTEGAKIGSLEGLEG